jgi:sporulation protein YlmC with PRC-barrel domain
MRKFLAAAVPALMLMAAAPVHAQTSGSARSNAVANGTMDSGARDVQASRAMIGKRVVHRHGGPVAGTVQNVTTDAQGQTMVELKLAKSGQTVMLPPASFERRGKQIIVMQDASELQQLAQYSNQANTGYGSSTGGTMGGQMGGSTGGMGSGAMNRGSMDSDSMNRGSMGTGTMNRGSMNQGSMNQGTMGNGTMNRGTMSPNQPGMGQ